ncbi:macro domain-containing protein [Alphaproteobacteria bacterium]|nr:macro domain-containing protein [Alphaproteobacteria bacterium]
MGGCPRGEARIICDYDLPATHMIHAVRPIWRSGSCGEWTLLASCFQEWLILASLYEVRIVAFPTISAGVYRCSLAATTPITGQGHRRIFTGDGRY